MADSKDTALTENTAPIGSDLSRMVDDPAGTPLSQRVYLGSLNLLPEGYMINGKLSVTVASNNITVALKTKSGGNPSATDPVSVWINGSYRRCTAALSVTKNAGTSWFGSGAAELATKERDYFAYLVWNTTPATDIMDLGFSPIPYGRVYSDFSATTTAQNYLATANASAPTSTDACVNIGRFAATLSATASFNWSVPTYTNANLIQCPTYETRWLNWVPTLTGFSADPTNTVYEYMVNGGNVIVRSRQVTAGTSNATTFTMTMPFTAKTLSNAVWHAFSQVMDNSALTTTPGLITLASGSAAASLFKDTSGAAWTGSATKRASYFELRYPLA